MRPAPIGRRGGGGRAVRGRCGGGLPPPPWRMGAFSVTGPESLSPHPPDSPRYCRTNYKARGARRALPQASALTAWGSFPCASAPRILAFGSTSKQVQADVPCHPCGFTHGPLLFTSIRGEALRPLDGGASPHRRH